MRATGSGSRSRSSLDAVFAATPLTSFTPYAHRRDVGGQHRGHVLRPEELATLGGRPPRTAGFVVRARLARGTPSGRLRQ